jgi:steroid delta-isomerase-like uncharacterized protein
LNATLIRPLRAEPAVDKTRFASAWREGLFRHAAHPKSEMTSPLPSTVSARLKLVEEHVRRENAHDLDGIMETFGAEARYDDEPWNAHYVGRREVRSFYRQMLQAMPGLAIEVRNRHASEEAIILEVVIRGQHLGAWRGLPATGLQIEFPLCGIFTFDEANRLAGEKIYYDRATVLRQLGVFHEPDSVSGQITTALTHPLTMARLAARKLSGR